MTSPLILITICVTLISLFNPASTYPHGNTFHVTQGQSIQAVIDNAHGGDKIVVEAGTYAEQLTISTNGITLEGHNAMIIPPPSPVTNTCSGLVGPGPNRDPNAGAATQAGICVTGSDIVFSTAPFDGEHYKVKLVGKRVKDIHISGFTVTGFSGLNIAVLGAQDAIISNNTLSSAAQYGVLTVGSKNSQIKHNIVIFAPGYYPYSFIGICMDDVSTVIIAHNDISDHVIGLCVQTSGAIIHDNNVHETCAGAFVDPDINGARIHNNNFSITAQGCQSFAYGVIISGGTNNLVKNNQFSGIKSGGLAIAVDVIDDPSGVISSGNEIKDNTFTDNDLDISDTATGKGNKFEKNACTSSNPPSLCP